MSLEKTLLELKERFEKAKQNKDSSEMYNISQEIVKATSEFSKLQSNIRVEQEKISSMNWFLQRKDFIEEHFPFVVKIVEKYPDKIVSIMDRYSDIVDASAGIGKKIMPTYFAEDEYAKEFYSEMQKSGLIVFEYHVSCPTCNEYIGSIYSEEKKSPESFMEEAKKLFQKDNHICIECENDDYLYEKDCDCYGEYAKNCPHNKLKDVGIDVNNLIIELWTKNGYKLKDNNILVEEYKKAKKEGLV